MGMKVNSKSITGPRTHTLVLPFGEGDDFIVFKFKALTARDNFEDVMPRPLAPRVVRPGKPDHFDFDDAGYKAKMEIWSRTKVDWEFLRSISATEGLEWDTVILENPDTWGNWRKDFENNFGVIDFSRIFGGFLEANSLSDEKIEEARARFLASQASEVSVS